MRTVHVVCLLALFVGGVCVCACAETNSFEVNHSYATLASQLGLRWLIDGFHTVRIGSHAIC